MLKKLPPRAATARKTGAKAGNGRVYKIGVSSVRVPFALLLPPAAHSLSATQHPDGSSDVSVQQVKSRSDHRPLLDAGGQAGGSGETGGSGGPGMDGSATKTIGIAIEVEEGAFDDLIVVGVDEPGDGAPQAGPLRAIEEGPVADEPEPGPPPLGRLPSESSLIRL